MKREAIAVITYGRRYIPLCQIDDAQHDDVSKVVWSDGTVSWGKSWSAWDAIEKRDRYVRVGAGAYGNTVVYRAEDFDPWTGILAGVWSADKAKQDKIHKTHSRELTDKVRAWLCSDHDDVIQDLTNNTLDVHSDAEAGGYIDIDLAVADLAERIEAFAGDYIEDHQPRGPLFVSVALDAIDWASIAEAYVSDVI